MRRALRNCNVLIVDDSQLFLSTVEGLLADEPDVTIVGRATSGQEGLDLATRLEPDLIFSDLAMPDLDGLELTRRINQFPSPPIVVIMTVHDQPQYRAAARAAGASAFLLKRDLVRELPQYLCSLRSDSDSRPVEE